MLTLLNPNPVFLGLSVGFEVPPYLALKGLPTKAKEARSPCEVRLSLLDSNSVFLGLTEIIITIIIIVVISDMISVNHLHKCLSYHII